MPEIVVVREAHEIPGRRPLFLHAGDVVTVGRRDDDWPAFVFVECERGAGWVPARNLSADSGRAAVLVPYDTTELPTRGGERLEVLARDDESGWHWCRNAAGREGWVPVRTLGGA